MWSNLQAFKNKNIYTFHAVRSEAVKCGSVEPLAHVVRRHLVMDDTLLDTQTQVGGDGLSSTSGDLEAET